MSSHIDTSQPTQVDTDSNECPRVVRFDDQCDLIPETELHRSPLPRFLQKSYSLPPVFRRTSSSPSPIEEVANADVIPNVSRPSLIARLSKKSPRRAASADRIPLSPCLVHHDHDGSKPQRPTRPRRPSLPELTSRSPSISGTIELATVPLRPCCAQCFQVTETCLATEEWQERFTRAARNRRNASAEFQKARKGLNVGAPALSEPFSAVTVDEIDKEKVARQDGLVEVGTTDGELAKSSRLEPPPTWATTIPANVLGVGLTRRILSPIPSRNASTEELIVARDCESCSTDEGLHDAIGLDTEGPSTSPPSSPLPRTPTPPQHSAATSPKSRFKLPASADLLRAGVDMLKGVGSFSPPTL